MPNQALKKQLEGSMPGMEAAISTLRERVDGPDVLAASRAAQNALIGSPMILQKTSAFRVIILCTTSGKEELCFWIVLKLLDTFMVPSFWKWEVTACNYTSSFPSCSEMIFAGR